MMKYSWSWGSGLSPFFTPEDFLPAYPSVKEDVQTEVLIIGGGLSGLLCAYELLKSGKEVTVVTANTVSDGASRFSTGTISADGGPDLARLRDLLGLEDAVSWYLLATSAVEQLEKILADTGSTCDFSRRKQFYYTSSRREASVLNEEYFLRHHIGLDCRWVGEAECRESFSLPGVGGILSEGGAELNPVKFCRDLADWTTLHGGRVLEGSRVDEIEAAGSERFLCRCGTHRITAKAVVDARGGDVLQKRPSLGQRVTVFSIATEPVSVFRGWPDRCLIKSHDGFSFLRTTPEGRIVFSGEASSVLTPEGRLGAVDANALCRVKYRNLEQDLKELMFGIPRVKKAYGFRQGIVLPKKGLPYVGKDPAWDGLYYLYSFGECGISGAVVGSAWINRMICDRAARAPQYLSL